VGRRGRRRESQKAKRGEAEHIGGDTVQWMPDNKTVVVQLVPAKRSVAPAPSNVPREPNWQESSGRPGPVRTFQDLLKTPYDEDLFEYYATAQLALVDAGKRKSYYSWRARDLSRARCRP
jgi:hypothetical protein